MAIPVSQLWSSSRRVSFSFTSFLVFIYVKRNASFLDLFDGIGNRFACSVDVPCSLIREGSLCRLRDASSRSGEISKSLSSIPYSILDGIPEIWTLPYFKLRCLEPQCPSAAHAPLLSRTTVTLISPQRLSTTTCKIKSHCNHLPLYASQSKPK